MNITENFIDAAFRFGRMCGRAGFPKPEQVHIERSYGTQAVDAFHHGYDHGYMERKTARITNENEEFDVDSYITKELLEMSKDTQFYLNQSRKDSFENHEKKKNNLLSKVLRRKVGRNV